MISAGNDIVALKCAGAGRAAQTKFYSKIITQKEFDLYSDGNIGNLLVFENYVWLLWSIKEAVFKYQKRHNPTLIFSPKKIIVQHIQLPVFQSVIKFDGDTSGTASADDGYCYACLVEAASNVFYAMSKVYDEVVHTTVNGEKDFGNIYWGIKRITAADHDTQAKSVRGFVLNTLSSIFPFDKFQIEKSHTGYPVLLKNGQPTNLALSFAHHENFVGYSFGLDGMDWQKPTR